MGSLHWRESTPFGPWFEKGLPEAMTPRRPLSCNGAHHALIDAIEKHDAQNASDLMRSHLVELLSGLDLSLGEKKPESLSDILR